MDKFEYGYVRMVVSHCFVSKKEEITGKEVVITVQKGLLKEELFPQDAIEWEHVPETHSQGRFSYDYIPGSPEGFRGHLKGEPLDYIQPVLVELGSEGWEVVEYRSSEDKSFAEALLKRKVHED